MIELLYFTGTGNSKRVLQVCGEVFEAAGATIRLESMTHNPTWNQAADMIGIGFPVFSLGAPRFVRQYLQSLPQTTAPRKVFVLATVGGRNEEGWALQEARELLEPKGYQVIYSDAVLFPDNWMPMAYVPNTGEAGMILQEAELEVKAIAGRILAGEVYHKPFVLPKFGPFWSRVMHVMFHRHGVYRLWKFFKVSPACNGCGLCARYCPMHAIRLEQGKPVWSVACEQCMRCINFCPTRAIRQLEWVGHGSQRNQYHEPHFNPAQE